MNYKRKMNRSHLAGRKSIITLALVFILLSVMTPVIINIIYSAGETAKHPIITILSASDLLAYLGALLSGLLTIAGVFFTVKYSQTQYREDMLNRVLPYLTAELIASSYKGDPLTEIAMDIFTNKQTNKQPVYEKPEIYESTVSQKLYFMVDKNLSLQYGLSEFNKKLYLEGLSYVTEGHVITCRSDKGKSFFSFNLINSGNGPAANLVITLIKENEKISAAMFPLHVSQKVYIALCIDSTAPRGDYQLKYEYKNIYGDRYMMKQSLTIWKDMGVLNMVLYDRFP